MTTTLTITDPHKMSNAERQAVIAFLSVQTVLAGAAAPRIAPADQPDAGVEIPVFVPVVTKTPEPAAELSQPKGLDAAVIFGKAVDVPVPPVAASVPVPPPVPTPPAPSAAEVASPPASAPAPTVAGPSGGVTLDARGLPWDVRIHASTKNTNADGAWKKKKNVEPAVISAVEAELRALMAVPVAANVPPPPGAMLEPAPLSFPALMQWVSKMVAEGKLTQADAVAVVQPIGLQSVIGLGNRPDLIPQVHAALIARAAEIEAGQQ